MENWKQIDGYKCYFVSDHGNVKTIDYNHTGTEQILNIFPNTVGYISVNLMQGTIRKRKFVHRLVSIAFLPNERNLPQVNHIDGNKANNHISNLEWCTCKENIHHACRTGLRKRSGRKKKIIA